MGNFQWRDPPHKGESRKGSVSIAFCMRSDTMESVQKNALSIVLERKNAFAALAHGGEKFFLRGKVLPKVHGKKAPAVHGLQEDPCSLPEIPAHSGIDREAGGIEGRVCFGQRSQGGQKAAVGLTDLLFGGFLLPVPVVEIAGVKKLFPLKFEIKRHANVR